MKKIVSLFIFLILLAACNTSQPAPTDPPLPTDTPQANMPNLASAYCEQQGYRLEMRNAADGSQSGVCLFPDGSECEEWAYYRGECQPGNTGATAEPTAAPTATETPPITESDIASDGCKIYRNTELGYSFHYPADASLELDPSGTLVSITGPLVEDNAWPIFMVSFPNDRPEFHVPASADLRQWLVDNNLYTDDPQPDVTIAGTTAIHTRFPRGQQSYANDRYYLVHDEQLFMITILHTGDQEDWMLYNHFLDSFQFEKTEANASLHSTLPTPIPIAPGDYQGWWTYTHAAYGFSIMLPEDWIVEEITAFDPQMNGHTLSLRPREIAPGVSGGSENIRMTFRRIGEDALLWPTGIGQGEFIPQGTLEIAGLPVQRVFLVCPAGEVTSIWYHQAEGQPNLARGDLEFGFIFSAGADCGTGIGLEGKILHLGEMIIASLVAF